MNKDKTHSWEKVDEAEWAKVVKRMKDKEKKRPQHVIDEEEVDLARERERDRMQMEMFDDPYMNWSGHR
tara:strand:+ start:234 stop:440 length:207 start_codon:yes stop_codon:yes gene_type:complete